ncbi:MAG: CRISPR-associated protein Csx20 [Bernardetiaceae bacterium]
MPTLYLLFSHTLTEAQTADAVQSLAVQDFVSLPEDLQSRWSGIPPELASLDDHLAPVLEWLRTRAQPEDFVLVQGDFGATFCVVDACRREGLGIPIYATTERSTQELPQPDGSIRKVSVFRHVRFRRFYPMPAKE